MWLRRLKYCNFFKKKTKKSKIFSLDSLMRKGSILNRERLAKNKIRNFKINIENEKKINTLPKFDLIIDCCAEPLLKLQRKIQIKFFILI